MKNFPKKLWTRLQDFKDAPALYTADDGRTEVSYWEWTRRIQNLAMALMDAGFETGTRLGMVAPTGRDWLDLAMATWLVGGCLVPLDPGRERSSLLRCLGRSGCGWIAVGDDRSRSRLQGAGGEMPDHLQWIHFDGEEAGDKTRLVEEMERRGRHLVQRGHTEKLAKRIYGLDRRAPTLILFDPEAGEEAEGALFSGIKIAWQLEAVARQTGLTDREEATVVTDRPFGRFASFLLTATALYTGHAVALPSDAEALDDELKTLQPTHLICGPDYLRERAEDWQQRFDAAPDALTRLVESGESDASALTRALGSIGEKAARKLLYDPIREEFGGKLEVVQVFEGRCPVGLDPIFEGADIALLGHFGLPETGITHIEHPEAHRPESCGRPIEGVATKLLEAKTGEAGELCIRGDTIFDDYWAGQGPRTVDDDGWLHTGRRARLESGYLFLED